MCRLNAEPPCTSGAVRLAGGTRPSEGRVEICQNNIFGTICDEEWSNEDAQVICRQLGFNDGDGMEQGLKLSFHSNGFVHIGAVAVPSAFFGRGQQHIHFNSFGCSGNELRWSACTFSTYTRFCGHASDASVLCLGKIVLLAEKSSSYI